MSSQYWTKKILRAKSDLFAAKGLSHLNEMTNTGQLYIAYLDDKILSKISHYLKNTIIQKTKKQNTLSDAESL